MCEHLHKRELMAADIVLGRGELFITGDQNDDQISVSTVQPFGRPSSGAFDRDGREFVGPIQIFPYGSIEVRVTDDRGFAQSNFYDPSSIQFINIDTGNGVNTVDFDVSIPSRIVGGTGVDTINGGESFDWIDGGFGDDIIDGRGGDDIIRGQGDVDTLHGGSGDDILYGGSRNDYLYGESGDDELFGNAGVDLLDGGTGDDYLEGGTNTDTLIGGSGDDYLDGGTGDDIVDGGADNDSLFGNLGIDAVITGTGLDRVLLFEGETEPLEDFEPAEDVTIRFGNSTTTYARPGGGGNAGPASWAAEEVRIIDNAFQLLFETTNSNQILKIPGGDEMFFRRRGTWAGSASGWSEPWSNEIVILDKTFVESNPFSAVQTTIHEVAHYHDTVKDNPYFLDFRHAATWMLMPDGAEEDYTKATSEKESDQDWHFRTNTIETFARQYGMFNPREDFATSFTARVLSEHDIDYYGEAPESIESRMKDRFAVLDKFFGSLS